MKFCKGCGEKYKNEEKFCNECGEKLPEKSSVTKKTTARKPPKKQLTVKKSPVKKLVVKKPTAKKTAAKKPAAKKPAAKKPAAKKPAAKKPAAKKPVVKKPVVKKPVVKKTTAKKTVTKKPVVKKTTTKKTATKKSADKLSEKIKIEEILDPNIKYRNLFEAYKDGKLPFAQGYIISSFFSETSLYSIYEVVSYAGLKEIFVTAEGLQFTTGGKKLYILVEPPTYHLKHQEPVSRSKSSGEFIPLRFNELDTITTKNQTKIMIAKEPIESFGSFTVLEPKGPNFAMIFYQLPDMFASIATFFKKSLNEQRKVAENDAKEASRRIAATIEKSMGFKGEYE